SLSKGSGTTRRNDCYTKCGGFDKLNHRNANLLDSLAKQNYHGWQSVGLAENSSLAARTPRQKKAKSSFEFCKAKPAKQNCHGWQSAGLAENSSLAARTPRQKNAKIVLRVLQSKTR
ncbi:MAG: hypothetical protein UHJ46_09425, partial [Treponema sp.]|nr:hypothetical protein [Treponema sp.]